ncbi:MAG: hypothetical protein GY824_04380 [Delftia sp.]|nr:hypothetical protein [Delftia sp.]
MDQLSEPADMLHAAQLAKAEFIPMSSRQQAFARKPPTGPVSQGISALGRGISQLGQGIGRERAAQAQQAQQAQKFNRMQQLQAGREAQAQSANANRIRLAETLYGQGAMEQDAYNAAVLKYGDEAYTPAAPAQPQQQAQPQQGAAPTYGPELDYMAQAPAQQAGPMAPATAPAMTPEEEAAAKTSIIKSDAAMTAVTASIGLLNDASESGMPASGTLSQPFALYSGSDAGKLRSHVRTLQSATALDAMLRLKQASRTGSTGFGAMNEKELDLLINDIGALDPDRTDPEILMDTLKRIKTRWSSIQDTLSETVPPSEVAKWGLESLMPGASSAAIAPPQRQTATNPETGQTIYYDPETSSWSNE